MGHGYRHSDVRKSIVNPYIDGFGFNIPEGMRLERVQEQMLTSANPFSRLNTKSLQGCCPLSVEQIVIKCGDYTPAISANGVLVKTTCASLVLSDFPYGCRRCDTFTKYAPPIFTNPVLTTSFFLVPPSDYKRKYVPVSGDIICVVNQKSYCEFIAHLYGWWDKNLSRPLGDDFIGADMSVAGPVHALAKILPENVGAEIDLLFDNKEKKRDCFFGQWQDANLVVLIVSHNKFGILKDMVNEWHDFLVVGEVVPAHKSGKRVSIINQSIVYTFTAADWPSIQTANIVCTP